MVHTRTTEIQRTYTVLYSMYFVQNDYSTVRTRTVYVRTLVDVKARVDAGTVLTVRTPYTMHAVDSRTLVYDRTRVCV